MVEPVAMTTASKSSCSCSIVMSMPTAQPVTKVTPSADICANRRSSTSRAILNSGMPYRISPPIRPSRSYTVTAWPALASCWAAASPAGPDPMTATDRPVDSSAGRGVSP